MNINGIFYFINLGSIVNKLVKRRLQRSTLLLFEPDFYESKEVSKEFANPIEYDGESTNDF